MLVYSILPRTLWGQALFIMNFTQQNDTEPLDLVQSDTASE